MNLSRPNSAMAAASRSPPGIVGTNELPSRLIPQVKGVTHIVEYSYHSSTHLREEVCTEESTAVSRNV
jgi:hypothetical protein